MQLDFACKRFDIEEVIRCGLALTKTDYKILKHLVETQEKIDSKEISKKLKVDLSTAQRSLKRLRERDLIIRKQMNLASGGYNLYYTSIPREEIKNILEKTVDNWTKKVKKELHAWID